MVLADLNQQRLRRTLIRKGPQAKVWQTALKPLATENDARCANIVFILIVVT
ncbi:hypothetical protein D3C71_2200150 [compost metagenome]